MNRHIRPLVLFSAAVWLTSGSVTYASPGDEPSAILSSLEKTVTERSLLIEGSLAYETGTDAWNLIVNDSIVFFVPAPKSHKAVPLRFVVALRYGDNTIAIDSLRKLRDGLPVVSKHCSTHIYAASAQNPHRFAILIDGESDSSAAKDLQAIHSQLAGTGLQEPDIFFARTRADMETALNTIRGETSGFDKLLIYFRGAGALSNSDGEPILHLSSGGTGDDNWVPVSQITRDAQSLPPVSFVLDVNFRESLNQRTSSPQGGQSTNADKRALPWLRAMYTSRQTEMVLSNPFETEPAGSLTHLLLSQASANPASACTTLADVARGFISSASLANTHVQPIYFASDASYSSFCVAEPTAIQQQLTIIVTRYQLPDPFMIVGSVETTLPPGISYSWREIVVDGVVVRHRFSGEPQHQTSDKITELVSFTEGRHLIEFRVGIGSKIIASGRTMFGIPSLPIGVKSQSKDLQAEILRPAVSTSFTSSGFFTIGFIVGDGKADSVHYELRNNGVVVLRGIAQGKIAQHLEILRRIPMSVGENNIVIEVSRNNYRASAHCTVTRHLEQPLRAVIIGIDQVSGLKKLEGVQSDTESMKKVLLNYTDLSPSALTTLTGSNATWSAIRQAIGNSTITHSGDPMSQAGGDETFFLYFSGYGTTLVDDSRKPVARCILAADFDSTDPQTACVSTFDLDHLLDAWKRSIVVFDTSYDGLSGATQQKTINSQRLFSRTYGDYLSTDPEWRNSAGTDRADRVFLVASRTNTAALESANPARGLFTSSLVDTVEGQTPERVSDSSPGLQLFDAFASARSKTILRSNKKQTPLIKGALSTPFYFKLRRAADLAIEARAIDHGILDDIQSLRSVDLNEIARAATLYDTVMALHAEDIEAQQGRIRLFIYQGDLDSADKLVTLGLAAGSSPTSSPVERSTWFLLRSELKMRRGDIAGALRDCEAANSTSPDSASVLSLLAALHFASAEYSKSAAIAEKLLDQAAMIGHDLTDDEWGHVVLLGYIAIRRSRGIEGSDVWLQRHFSSNPEQHSFPAQLGRALVAIPKSIFAYNTQVPVIKIQSPWFQLAAEFFLQTQSDASNLLSFNEKNSSFDAKEPNSVELMAHFYQGMKFIIDSSPARAKKELELATKSDKTQLAEYWIARAEHDRID